MRKIALDLAVVLLLCYSVCLVQQVRGSYPQGVPIIDVVRDVMCKECFNYTDAEMNSGADEKCPRAVPEFKFGLRNYGCNCFSDNFDTTWQNGKAWSQGIRGWAPGANGPPVDPLDEACLRMHKRLECVRFDLANGDYQLVADRTQIEDRGGRGYQRRSDDCDAGKPYADPYVKGDNYPGWDNCMKMTQYECGPNLVFPKHRDADGTTHCGFPDNPDYVNGIPEGEECQAHMCFISMEFAKEVMAEVILPTANCSLWDYLVDHRENYFTYANHINMTYNDGIYSGKLTLPDELYEGEYEYWLQAWHMSHDGAGNSPKYFDTRPNAPYNPLVHWYQEYSTATDNCVKPPPRQYGALQCCGQQPFRYPYRDLTHECCHGIIVERGSC